MSSVHDEGDEGVADSETAEESEDSDEGGAEETVVAPRPRAKRAGQVSAVSAGTPITNFGSVPVDVTHWLIKRQTINGSQIVGWAPPGAIAELREFPIADLSEQTISDRWGAGQYVINWVRHLAGGGRAVLKGAREVCILPQIAPPPLQPSRMSALDDHLAFLGIVEERSKSSLRDVLELAKFFGQQQQPQGAITLDGLRLLMREERDAAAAATTAAIAAAVEPLKKQIEELTEDDEEDDDVVASAARAAGPRLFKGGKWWQQLGQLATEHPDLVKSVAPIVAGAVQQVAGAVISAVGSKQQQQAPEAPPQRPRAVMTQAAPALHGEVAQRAHVSSVAEPLVPPPPGTATSAELPNDSAAAAQ